VIAREWASQVRVHAQPNVDIGVLERLGSPELHDGDVACLQQILELSGARAHVERRIIELVDFGCRALPQARFVAVAEDALTELARHVAWRSR
jgi:hypothetical protein